MQSDAELVAACLNGQKQAFEVLVRRYRRPVRAVALNVLGDYHWANDAAQDAFVKAYEKLPKLRKQAVFGPWLMKITHRCALDYQKQRFQQTSLEAAATENRNGQLDEEKQRLLAAVLKLPKHEKQVIMLRYFANHSVADIAEMVGRSIGTVTKQLSRARERLRKMLKGSEK